MSDTPVDPIVPPSPEVQEARAQLDAKRADPSFVTKFTAGDAQTRAEVSRLTRIAAGQPAPEAPNPAQPNALSREDAKAKIELLRADKDFIKKFAEGDADARKTMADLNKAAFSAHEQTPQISDEDFVKAFDDIEIDTTGSDEAEATEARQLAKETAVGLGLDPQIAKDALRALQGSIAARGQRVMDGGELQQMDALLSSKWGPDLNTNNARFAQVVRDLGRGGDWLRAAIIASGPQVAAEIIHVLVTAPRRSRAA